MLAGSVAPLSSVLDRIRHPARRDPTPEQIAAAAIRPVRVGAVSDTIGYAAAVTYPGVQKVSDGKNDPASTPLNPPRGFAKGGGRVSWDDIVQFMGGFQYILPPDDYTESWRTINLDASTIRRMSATRLLQVLADVAPDVSRGLWDFLRLCNPGWECTAYKPGTTQPHTEGQKVLDAWTASIASKYGSVDVPVGRLHFGAFLRGALMAELVLDENARMPVDLATPDPSTARFRRRLDPVLGQVWDLGQFQMANWVRLDRPTIRYVPIDAAPGSPYGRSPSAPALFASLFLLGLLHDLRRVVAQQGYPRYDLEIALEALEKMVPPQVKADPNAWKQFVDDTTDAVANAYAALEPDSAFVHTDLVKVNRPTGAISADVLGGVGELIKALERLLARALKSMPLLMGSVEGSSEANANRQWELQAAGIKAVQHLSESIMSDFGTLVLEAQGVGAECKWTFAELRAAEMYRDAMTKSLIVDTATKTYFMGWESQESASMEATGHEPDQPEPRLVPSTEVPPAMGQATATGEPAKAPGGRQNARRPNKGNDNTGGDTAEVASTGDKPEREMRSPRSRREFLRLRWPDTTLEIQETLQGPRWERADSKPEPMHPLGRALPYVPENVRYDAGEQRQIARTFDNAVPSYAGLLDARVADSDVERRWRADEEMSSRAVDVGSSTPPTGAASVDVRQLVERPTDMNIDIDGLLEDVFPPPVSRTAAVMSRNGHG